MFFYKFINYLVAKHFIFAIKFAHNKVSARVKVTENDGSFK